MRLQEKILSYKFRQTTLIIIGSLAALAGVGLARWHFAASGWTVFILAACALLGFRSKKFFALIIIVLFGLSLGLWRGSIYMDKLGQYNTLAEQKITIRGIAQEDAVYGKHSQLTFPVSNVQVTSPYPQKLSGTISVAGFGEAMIYRGDKVEASGKLFPTRGNNQAVIDYASINVTQRGHSLVNDLRRRFVSGVQTALPEPLASFGLGLLIGQRVTLPAGIATMLTAVGLTHIIAVSGYNLTILIEAVRRSFGKRSKRQTMLFSLLLIGLFLLLAGTSASITRAALVSILTLLAWFYGRNIKPLVLILFVAALTAAYNPFYEWSNIGWYLSFLAFYGVLVLEPLITKRLYAGRGEPSTLARILIETLCAEIMTIPLILYIFGQVSLVTLPANGLVLLFVPLAMLLTFVAGLAGMLIPVLAGWLAWPAKLLLTYMLDIVSLLNHIPHIFVQALVLPLTKMLGLYVLIVGVTFVLWQKTKVIKSDTITDEKTAVTSHPELVSGSRRKQQSMDTEINSA